MNSHIVMMDIHIIMQNGSI